MSAYTVPDAALKQKNVRLLMALFKHTVWLTGSMTDKSLRSFSVSLSVA
jgi:hypothetical protein